MKESQTNITYRRLELKLSKIAAKIADATDLSRQAKDLICLFKKDVINVRLRQKAY